MYFSSIPFLAFLDNEDDRPPDPPLTPTQKRDVRIFTAVAIGMFFIGLIAAVLNS